MDTASKIDDTAAVELEEDPDKAKKQAPRIVSLPISKGPDGKPVYQGVDNHVKTSKYEIYDFLPLNIYEQFQKVANVYFLVLSILACFSEISPYAWYTMGGPFAVILGLTMCKDAYSDYFRHVDDSETNNKTATVLTEAEGFQQVAWQEVRVGQIIEIKEDEPVPADVFILASQLTAMSDEEADKLRSSGQEVDQAPDANSSGIVFVDTAELDGETNLKLFQGFPDLAYLHKLDKLVELDLEIEIDAPNGNLHMADGTAIGKLEGGWPAHPEHPDRPQKLIMSKDNILLRGMSVRNTKIVWGVVLYTGHESKIMLNNANEAEIKVSMVDRTLNTNLYIILAMLLFFCVICAVMTGLWVKENIKGSYDEGSWYVALSDGFSSSFTTNWYGTTEPDLVGLCAVATFLLLFANLVPISLYFTIELVKLFTGFMIDFDIRMYDPDKDMPAKCRNNNIIEEAGQIEYVLSDKTGTLTQNKMELLKFSANGTKYGKGITEIEIARARINKQSLEPYVKEQVPGEPKPKFFPFYDPAINGYKWTSDANCDGIRKFLMALAICHTTVPEEQEPGVLVDGIPVKMNAASPDDGALVKACFNLGIRFMKRTMKPGHIDELTFMVYKGGAPGEEEWEEQIYNVLETIDFTSSRKRMSVVAQGPDGKIRIYMKGADNFIKDRLKASEFLDAERTQDGPALKATQEHTDQFSQDGLRCLFVASHEVETGYFKDWHAKYMHAMEEKDKDTMHELEEEIEKDMEIHGATAIEDKLQVNVGKCLTQMRNADIRTWVLTGDKVGTAIMIGFACELLTEEMYQIKLEERDEVTNKVRNEDEIMKKLYDDLQEVPRGSMQAIVIDGAALLTLGIGMDYKQTKALEKNDPQQLEKLLRLQREFITTAQDCHAVLCCRVSPAQKGALTRLVRQILGKVVVGIGDGANDVGMILEAHVGIGVQGVEGSQAVNSADFAINQFQHLSNIILVHGRWTYYRLCKAICYFFYKNIVNVFTVVWYAMVTGFSGTLQYDDMVLCMYNLFFTSLPVIFFALLEQDVDYEDSILAPQIYKPGQKSELLNMHIFFIWVLEAVYAATVIFVVPYNAMGVTKDGLGDNLQMVGLTMYSINIWAVTLRLALETQFWTWIHFLVYGGSVALWYLFMMIEFAFPEGFAVTSGYMYWSSYNLWSTSYHWLSLLLGIWVAVLPAFVRNCYEQCFLPSVNEATRRAVHLQHEQDEKRRVAQAEARANMTEAEQQRRTTLFRGNMSFADEMNPVHVMQGRSTKVPVQTLTTIKAAHKFKGLSKSFKMRKSGKAVEGAE